MENLNVENVILECNFNESCKVVNKEWLANTAQFLISKGRTQELDAFVQALKNVMSAMTEETQRNW